MSKRVLLTTWLVAASALAQDAGFLGYKIYQDPFPYYVYSGPGVTETGLSQATISSTVQAAYATWRNVSCSYVDFTFAGTRASAGTPGDAFSVSAIWVTSADDPFYAQALGGGEAVAAAIPLTYAGAVTGCDIYLNKVDFSWNVTGSSVSVDLQTAITREIGHCLGLADGFDEASVMFGIIEPGNVRRTLSATDEAQLCTLYRKDGYGSPCVYDGGQGSCNQPGRNLKCITALLPSGATSTPFCSEGCPYSATTNSCESPHVCRNIVLFPPQSGSCMPNNNDVTQVGAPCDGGTVASCGPTPRADCFLEDSLPSEQPLWKGGYCSQSCTVGVASSCPSASSCVDLGGGEARCLQSCRAGSGDCRPGYSCAALPGQAQGVCISSCGADNDCPNGSGGLNYCRSCDGLCFSKENTGAQIGDRCTNDSTCGPAQFCYHYPNTPLDQGVCTQPCTTTCTACPNGSFCAEAPGGVQVCLRHCQEGTCATGQQCGVEGDQRGCKPPCRFDLDCPDPWRCSAGQCVNPFEAADAGGTCALCFAGEGGAGSPNPSVDGGSGGGGGSNCGCQSGGDVLTLWASGVLGLLWLGRRRRWRLH